MVDIPGRMTLPSRNRLVWEGSGMSSSGGSSLGTVKDLKTILGEQEPMSGSNLVSAKQVDDIMQQTAKCVGDGNVEWTKRINMLKQFRSLIADSQHHTQVGSCLRQMIPALQSAVKDPRSQVCREACTTVAIIAVKLRTQAHFFMEPILGVLFNLMVANGKVVSSTGLDTVLIIYEFVADHRLVPPLQTQMTESRSKDVYQAVCQAMQVILQKWPAQVIQKNLKVLTDLMKKGIVNADGEARTLARACFPDFRELFPQAAATVLESLDPLQRRQLQQFLEKQASQGEGAGVGGVGVGGGVASGATQRGVVAKTNGTRSWISKSNTSSLLTRQGSFQKPTVMGIPMLSSRESPVKTGVNSGRSTSAIDLQAATRARQHYFSSLNNRTPSSTSSIASSSSVSHSATASAYSAGPTSIPNFISASNSHQTGGGGTSERSCQRSPTSRLSQSQPGSRSNSPSSKYAYAAHNSPCGQSHLQQQNHRHLNGGNGLTPQGLSFVSPPGREGRRFSDTSSASSSRDTSPTGRFGGKLRSFSMSSIDTADDVQVFLTKCGSAKGPKRQEGLLGLQSYLARHVALPRKHLSKIGHTLCLIFMDVDYQELSLFVDVLHTVLHRHARDLEDFTTIWLIRVLTKLGSDLLTSVHTKLLKTLEILTDQIPADIQFSAVTHYLCDSTQTPNSSSRVAALCHIYNLSEERPISVKMEQLPVLVDNLLDWCADTRSHEPRRLSLKVFCALFDMAAPQMTVVLGNLSPHKQDQAKQILITHARQLGLHQGSHDDSSPSGKGGNGHADRLNISGGWGSIHSDIQALSINDSVDGASGCGDLLQLMALLAATPVLKKTSLLPDFLTSIKDATDETLIAHHEELLALISDTVSEIQEPVDQTMCFLCLEELCSRPGLAGSLSQFAELIIVRVTDVQTAQMARDVSRSAELCGMALAVTFPPEILVRTLCPIVQNKEFPVNQMAIKMLQRMCDSCEVEKIRALLPNIMNTLIQANDHPDSAVRMPAVFAMVAIHLRIGSSELQPYLSKLRPSQLKVLRKFIQRAEQQD